MINKDVVEFLKLIDTYIARINSYHTTAEGKIEIIFNNEDDAKTVITFLDGDLAELNTSLDDSTLFNNFMESDITVDDVYEMIDDIEFWEPSDYTLTNNSIIIFDDANDPFYIEP